MVGSLTVNSDNSLSGQFVASDGSSASIAGHWSQSYSGPNGADATASGTYSTLAMGTVALTASSVIYIDNLNFSDGHLRGSIFAMVNGQQTEVLALNLAKN